MRRRWTEMVPAMRVHLIVALICMAVCLVGIALVVVGVPTFWLGLLLITVFVVNVISSVVAVIVGRRQEIDAAVQRGRRWDEEHAPADGETR